MGNFAKLLNVISFFYFSGITVIFSFSPSAPFSPEYSVFTCDLSSFSLKNRFMIVNKLVIWTGEGYFKIKATVWCVPPCKSNILFSRSGLQGSDGSCFVPTRQLWASPPPAGFLYGKRLIMRLRHNVKCMVPET